MKDLGVKVLSKIENLISEIDKPHIAPKASHKKSKKQQLPDRTLHPRQGATRSQYYVNKMSYAYLDRQKQTLSKQITHSYQAQNPVQLFHITNKQTINILKKKSLKPIYQRLDQILNQKKMHVNLLAEKKYLKEENSMIPQISAKDYSPEQIMKRLRKMNPQDLEQFRNLYDEKNQQRLKKRHLHQLSRLDKETSQATPSVGKHSKNLSKMRNLKKNYSADVFKRLNQDCFDRGERRSQLRSKIVQEQGGFRPVLCQKSKLLAQQSKSNRSLCHNDKNHSSHKKCKASIPYTPQKRKSYTPSSTTKENRRPQDLKQSSSPTIIKTVPFIKQTQKLIKSIKEIPTQKRQEINVKVKSPLKGHSKSNRLLNALIERDHNQALKKQERTRGTGRIDDWSLRVNRQAKKKDRNKLVSLNDQKYQRRQGSGKGEKKQIWSSSGVLIKEKNVAKTPEKSNKFVNQSSNNLKRFHQPKALKA